MISYGMGTPLIAEELSCSVKEAEDILNGFYEGFPKVKAWKDGVESFAKQNGYVEDLWGRRRRLPDLFLPPYEFKLKEADSATGSFNPLLGAKPIYSVRDNPLIKKYRDKCANVRGFKELQKIKEAASKEGVIIYDNSNKISSAERQCVNAVIQGSAATMTKKAMIKVHNDELLNNLGFRLLIPVHDELIGECPSENADAVSKRLVELMVSTPENDVSVPFKCDPVIESSWYFTEYVAEINDIMDDLRQEGVHENELRDKILEMKPEAKYVMQW